jgi:hypothetical protein
MTRSGFTVPPANTVNQDGTDDAVLLDATASAFVRHEVGQ